MYVNLETQFYAEQSEWTHPLDITAESAETGGAGRGENGMSPRRALPGGGTIRR